MGTYTNNQERFAGGGRHGWNRVTGAGEIRDCGDDAENLDVIKAIEDRGNTTPGAVTSK